MPKFKIGEICLIINSTRGPLRPPLECEVIGYRADKEAPYKIKVPGYPSKNYTKLWSAPESWLRKKPRPGADIVRDMIKNFPKSNPIGQPKEREKCYVLK